MNIALWIAQALLALVFLGAGFMKASQPKEKLEAAMPWTASFPLAGVRAIGVAEVLGAIGLILPAATGIATVLTPLAAVGLAVTMVGAAIFHAQRKEYQAIGVNVVLLAIAVFIAWGRFGPYAI